MSEAQPLPKNIGVVLFPGFQLLDAAGPLDALNILSLTHPLNLSILAHDLSPVSTRHHLHQAAGSNCQQSIVPTHTFANAPDDIEVLIIPGGTGSRKEENLDGVIEFLQKRWGSGGEEKKGALRWILTVCTGSAILAKSGVLDGRRATSNKKAFSWVREQNEKVEWVPKARWVKDGDIWTSSGIAAGIDMIYAWLEEVFGKETADLLADASEYERNRDPGNDRFAERWGAV
ncbi:DJ-1/PfpI family protein-like protein [Aaosphaeria arxii CBS 175.79]|uniref:DJ-1/PfpI family protein-like protein n=1 Tax=Aaosphaeria arxii CBS 175.79 TaxID=1450172 RepID=A0A6A5XQN4_9PLEO|nr:DJ-1/PfpI family protein-like protein [Aaosphaeria arxii CBS 175.79]KAF2015588.1 DJ-1/PfpI family protein-like protein [Aaosphaeria arxii CBS 175.79]